jgi:WD40 repeat protein
MQLRSHDFKKAACVATLVGHSGFVRTVAFHSTEPILATGSDDSDVKLWRILPHNWTAICVATLKGHDMVVRSVAFHLSAPLLASGSDDNTVRLWRMSPDNLSASCVATLSEHVALFYDGLDEYKVGAVRSVAFHPKALLLASGDQTGRVLVWRISPHNWSVTLMTLHARNASHGSRINCIAFHATELLMATGSDDKTVKLWRIEPDHSSATFASTLQSVSSDTVRSVAFHAAAPFLAIGSRFLELWHIGPDYSSATRLAHSYAQRYVNGVSFHPTAHILAVGMHMHEASASTAGSGSYLGLCHISTKNITEGYRHQEDIKTHEMSWTGVLTGDHEDIDSVAFHPAVPILVSGGSVPKLWR